MNAVQHPTKDELVAFSSGLVEEASLSSIEEDLAECVDCRAVMKSLPPDDMVTLLRETVMLPDSPWEMEQFPGTLSADADLPRPLENHPRYRIVGRLGSGGMGVVFLAEHRLMKRLVAIKVINQRLLKHSAAIARFQREMEVIARLSHPNIAAAFDADHVQDVHFLVMEFVEGCSLAKLVRERSRLSVTDACNYIIQAAAGLQHAHDQNLVHRDIKPHNLMLTSDGTVKILDFGLAFLHDESPEEEIAGSDINETISRMSSLTDFGKGVGTPAFVAPEQIRDAHATDLRADVYSLGCTLYYLLAGHCPFASANRPDIIKRHVENVPFSLDSIRQDVPAPLLNIIRRMMDKNVDRRMSSMNEVAASLTPYAGRQLVRKEQLVNRNWLWALGPALALVVTFGLYNAFSSSRLPRLAKEILQFDAHSGGVRNVALSRDGNRLLSVGGDNAVRLWEVKTGGLVREFVGHTGAGLSVAFSPDETKLISGGADFCMRVWDTETGQEITAFPTQNGFVHAVAFAPDGEMVASGCHDNSIQVWDLATGVVVQRFEGHQAGIMGVAFVPETHTLLSCSNDQTTRLWDIASGKELRRYRGHTAEVMGLALAPDGRRFATGSHDGTVRLWNIGVEEELQRKDAQMNVTCVAFAPDGKKVLFGGWIGERAMSACLWDIRVGVLTDQMIGHQGRVSCVSMIKDGKRAITGSEDGTIRIWQLR